MYIFFSLNEEDVTSGKKNLVPVKSPWLNRFACYVFFTRKFFYYPMKNKFPVIGEGLETDRNNMDCSRDAKKFIFKLSCFHKFFVRTMNFDVITSSALRE